MADPIPPLRGTEDFPLTRRELVLVAAFWTCYALLMVAARVFDSGPGPRLEWRSGPVVTTLAESFCWALLTPAIFRMAARLGGAGRRAAVSAAVFVVAGIGIATLLSLAGDAIRAASPPPPRPPRGGGPHRGPPNWFGFLNALVVYAGVLAAGLARAYSLRFRARREQAA